MKALLLLLVLLAADPAPLRPSSADVAAAVAASRAENTPSQAEQVGKLRRRLQRERSLYAQLRQLSGAQPRKDALAALRAIRDLEKQIRAAEKSDDPPDGSGELSRVDWPTFAVGDVGRATERGAKYTYRCERILSNHALLLQVLGRNSRPLLTVHLDKYATAGLHEGLAVNVEFDVVAVGRFCYTDADGAARNVLAIETFDPDAEFE